MKKKIKFKIINEDSSARLGKIFTKRGVINTPAFMPVGTLGTIKAMFPEMVKECGSEIILSNTYHLMLRPGVNLISEFGGLHKFMNWESPILTDSGGFQVMSLSSRRKINERGVIFKSHIDGEEVDLTPEKSIMIQSMLGSDIIMCFDECTPYPASEEFSSKSMKLSMRWAKRCKQSTIEKSGSLFGIMQGNMYKKQRYESANKLIDLNFEGYAIGGLAVGESQKEMFEVLDYAVDFLPKSKPRYLMGVGKPLDIIGAVSRGVDMFDCVIPTRSGRTGQAFTTSGIINIKNSKYKSDKKPLDEQCGCMTCVNYSRAYLHHVFKSKEIISSMLLTFHNIFYYQQLMINIRRAIENNNFLNFVNNFCSILEKNNDSF